MLDENSYFVIITTMIFPITASIILTLIFYIKALYKLERNINPMFEGPKMAIKNIYKTSFFQLVTICPMMIYELVNKFYEAENNIMENIAVSLLGLTGVINVILYFLRQKPYPRITEAGTEPELLHAYSKSIETSLILGMNDWT